jgi:CubicO group peptidase (beta-lactamase class C family)
MFSRVFLCLVVLFGPGLLRGQAVSATVDDARMKEILEPIRQKNKVPALAAALVTVKGLEKAGAVGVRKAGTDIPVTVDDLWHLGSDTKAMTATMIGALVEKGVLKWESTPADLFPDLPESAPTALKKANLLHLLSHRSGLPGNIPWPLIPRTGSTREQRRTALKIAAGLKTAEEPPAPYVYSNLGYVVAGAMAEKAADASWEDLMRKTVFEPLGMDSAGFGGIGTPGQIDQPWPHGPNGAPETGNGPEVDNAPVIGPAGIVHCRLADWAKFVADQLRGDRGEPSLLKTETYKRLHTPPFPGTYALGWLVAERDWAGGPMLAHNGSNNMNYASVFMAPIRGFAVLVVCNQGGAAAGRACDEAASSIIQAFRKEK